MSATPPKRHHFVPQSFLKAWANESDQVAVRRRDSGKVFTPHIKNVALESGLYGQGEDAKSTERAFAEIEGRWPALYPELVSQDEISVATRNEVALLVSLQIARTPDRIAQVEFFTNVVAFAGGVSPTREVVARYLREVHLGFDAPNAEVDAAWSLVSALSRTSDNDTNVNRMQALGVLINNAFDKLLPLIFKYAWTVEHCRKRTLVVTDRPVTFWTPSGPMDQVKGVGLGTAEEVRVPVGPQHLLVLRKTGPSFKRDRVEPGRFYEVNIDAAARCSAQVIASVHRREYLAGLTLKRNGPTMRFNMAPLHQRQPDGTVKIGNEVIHTWTPRY